MAGYSGYSKSNNAVSAEADGKFPASVVAKKLKIPIDFLKEKFEPTEWHHTSARYNKTDYYDLGRVETYLATKEGKAELAAFKAKAKAKSSTSKGWSKKVLWVKWIEWGGSISRPKPFELKLENVVLTFNGTNSYSWLTPKGEKITKRGTTNGFSFYTKENEAADKKRMILLKKEEKAAEKERKKRFAQRKKLTFKASAALLKQGKPSQYFNNEGEKAWVVLSNAKTPLILDFIPMNITWLHPDEKRAISSKIGLKSKATPFEEYRALAKAYLAKKGKVYSAEFMKPESFHVPSYAGLAGA